jgi:uncharacterized protein (DUF2461 family)
MLNDPSKSPNPTSKPDQSSTIKNKPSKPTSSSALWPLLLPNTSKLKQENQSNRSSRNLKKVTDARIYDKINKREFVMRSKMNDGVKKILEMILPH